MNDENAVGGGGIGAFNLVRRDAYDRIGGHALLAMDTGDDFKLGRLLKESGARQQIMLGHGLVACPWHRGTLATIRGLEKNFFGGFDYSVAKLVAATAAQLTLTFAPLALAASAIAVTPAVGTNDAPAWLRAFAAVPLVLQVNVLVGTWWRSGRRTGMRGASLLLHPLAVLGLVAAQWNSAVHILAAGGVRWRDTFYSLDALRRGLVAAGTGARFIRPAAARAEA